MRLGGWGRAIPILIVALAASRAPSQESPSGELAKHVGEVIGEERFRTAHWGILVVDAATGATVYEHQADKLFAPASVTKLFSVAAAMDALGADYRFITPIYAQGKLEGSHLAGSLILVASGDPTLGGRTDDKGRIAYTNGDHIYASFRSSTQLTGPDPLAGLNELARQVGEKVKTVGGDVLVDDRLFEHAESTGSGPRRVTPMMVNDNLIDLTIEPTSEGQPAIVRWRPESVAVRVDAQVTTVGPRTGEPKAGSPATATEIDVDTTSSGAIVVRGRITADSKPIVGIQESPRPDSFARSLLIEALRRHGVAVSASPLAENRRSELPGRDAYAMLRKVGEFTSPPFSEHARLVLKVSHNLHASALPLLVAAKAGKRTLGEGLRIQHDFFRRGGLEPRDVSFGGAAGGARGDYVTPRATVVLLRHMASRKDFAAYKEALPVLGVDGTLAKAVGKDSPARGKVFAKTGTLYWENTGGGAYLLTSKALAGYATAANGRELAFAMFVNNLPVADGETAPRRIGETLGKLCEILHRDTPAAK
jgi:serine-type D-Ala-D-Ala carboxypeptidase/endopeptidase (penicillin-binding protein 4)